MDPRHGNDIHASVERMLWRDQVRLLPGSLLAAARRLLRMEPRWYLIVDGRVAARMTGRQGYSDLLTWIGESHRSTYLLGVKDGAQGGYRADAGELGTP